MIRETLAATSNHMFMGLYAGFAVRSISHEWRREWLYIPRRRNNPDLGEGGTQREQFHGLHIGGRCELDSGGHESDHHDGAECVLGTGGVWKHINHLHGHIRRCLDCFDSVPSAACDYRCFCNDGSGSQPGCGLWLWLWSFAGIKRCVARWHNGNDQFMERHVNYDNHS